MKTINSKHAKPIQRSRNARFARVALAAIAMAGSALLGSFADAGTGRPASMSLVGTGGAVKFTANPASASLGNVELGAAGT
jgi:hypothetical protein